MAVFDATTNGAVCEPTVVSMRTIRSRAACCVRRERTAAAPARGRSKHVPLHPDRFQVPAPIRVEGLENPAARDDRRHVSTGGRVEALAWNRLDPQRRAPRTDRGATT